MTVIRPNSITGISSIVANGSTVEFRNTAGNRITIDADITGNLTGDISGSITGNMVATQNAGIQTTTVTNAALVGAGNSFVGMYIGDGSILFNSTLSRSGGYYVASGKNALNAGPVTLESTMTLDGTWVIV